MAIAALVLCTWLLANSTLGQARDSAIAAAIGVLIYFAFRLTVPFGSRTD